MYNFTKEDVMLYIFNELPKADTDAMRYALATNEELFEAYVEMKSTVKEIDKQIITVNDAQTQELLSVIKNEQVKTDDKVTI